MFTWIYEYIQEIRCKSMLLYLIIWLCYMFATGHAHVGDFHLPNAEELSDYFREQREYENRDRPRDRAERAEAYYRGEVARIEYQEWCREQERICLRELDERQSQWDREGWQESDQGSRDQ